MRLKPMSSDMGGPAGGLLQPSLSGRAQVRAPYSTLTGFLTAFLGGPFGIIALTGLNSWRLLRLKWDLLLLVPATLITLVLAPALGLVGGLLPLRLYALCLFGLAPSSASPGAAHRRPDGYAPPQWLDRRAGLHPCRQCRSSGLHFPFRRIAESLTGMDQKTAQRYSDEIAALLERRRVAQAKMRLREALQLYPEHAGLLTQSAWADYFDNDHDAALASVQDALTRAPRNQDARILLFRLHEDKNDLAEAERVALELLQRLSRTCALLRNVFRSDDPCHAFCKSARDLRAKG